MATLQQILSIIYMFKYICDSKYIYIRHIINKFINNSDTGIIIIKGNNILPLDYYISKDKLKAIGIIDYKHISVYVCDYWIIYGLNAGLEILLKVKLGPFQIIDRVDLYYLLQNQILIMNFL